MGLSQWGVSLSLPIYSILYQWEAIPNLEIDENAILKPAEQNQQWNRNKIYIKLE